MAAFLSRILENALPHEVSTVLGPILGKGVAPAGEDGRHEIAASGRFGGPLTESCLAMAEQSKSAGALVVAEEEIERVLYLREGVIVGAASNALFERLGRILYQAGVVTHDDSEVLMDVEETLGDEALIDWLPEDTLAWAVRRRAAAVAGALPFVRRGHFVLVDGEVDLQGLPVLSEAPAGMAAEARRLYEAWRHGSTEAPEEAGRRDDTPEPLPSPLRPRRTRQEEVDDIFRRIREADLGFK